MATANFYESGNHGLNVIAMDYEEEAVDTLDNIESELKGYSFRDIRMDSTPRSFDTGVVYSVFKGHKVVAILELCSGYYEGANINIYTDEHLLDEYDRDEVTYNKRDIAKVVKAVKLYTTQYGKAYQFSNGETGYVQV